MKTVNNVSTSCIKLCYVQALWFKLNEPIKIAHLQILANQSMLNDALVIEMVNNSFSESILLIEKNRNVGSEKYISTRFR